MNQEVTYRYVADTRIPLSLRLPPKLIRPIESYAAEHRISKTDAFIHFLELGLERNCKDRDKTLDEINNRVGEILDILKTAKSPKDETEQVRNAVCEAAQSFPAILRVFLFGSFARGTFSDSSDIDLRIELDKTQQFNLHDMVHFSKRIEQKTGRTVDVVSAQDLKNENLAASIEREKVLIYERKD